MKKNGTTLFHHQLQGHLDTKNKHPELKNEDDDDLPTTEEVEDSEANDEDDQLELIFRDSVKEELNRKYDSIEKLSITLKLHQDPRTDKLADSLSDSEITGPISSKSLFNTLVEFVIQCMKPLKIKEGDDKDQKLLDQRDLLQFYLTIFNFTPNTMVKDKKNKKNGRSILMLACQKTQNPYFPELLVNDLKADIHECSQDGRRMAPLHFACLSGHIFAVKCLVGAGADINQGRITPLGIALSEKQHHIVHFLLTQDAIDATLLSDGVDPYLLAAQHAVARNFLALMLKKNVNPNMLTSCNESALSIALSRTGKSVKDSERDDIVRILLKSSVFNVDINLPASGESALFIAARMDNLFALNLLLEKGADCEFVVTRGPYKGHSVLSIAVYEGNYSIVKRLIEICTLDFSTTFSIGYSRLDHTLLSLCFANAKSNKDNKENHELVYTLLQAKWVDSHPDQARAYIKKVIKKDDTNELLRWKKFILSRKSISPETGNTPLHWAAFFGRAKSIQCLFVQVGVPHNSQNIKGDTPLHLACRKKQANAVSQLLILGASPDMENNEAQTPFLLAMQLRFESCLRAFVGFNYDRVYEIPSIESALVGNDELLAKIIGEYLPPTVETSPVQTARPLDPLRSRNKKKAHKKNQRKSYFFASISEKESHTAQNQQNEQHLSSSQNDCLEGDGTTARSREAISTPQSPVIQKDIKPTVSPKASSAVSNSSTQEDVTLPLSPESIRDKNYGDIPYEEGEVKLKFRSYFSHPICSNGFKKNAAISGPAKNHTDFTYYMFFEIKESIEKELHFIANNIADIMVKVSLQALIDAYSSLNYLAVIGLLSEKSPILLFIQALRAESLSKGLDLNNNVSDWSSKAIEVYKSMLSAEGIFHLDTPPESFEIPDFGI